MLIRCGFGILGVVLVLSASAVASTEEAAVVTGDDGASFGARWMLPDSTVRAVVLIVPGSGNIDMDGEVSGPLVGRPHLADSAKLSLQLARSLSAVGIASLRYNKRGFDDPAQLDRQIVSIMAKDARAISEQAQNRFPKVKFGLIGFSEGSIIAAIVASEHPVSALFLLGFASHPVDEMLYYQFVEWPLELLKSRLHANSAGEIELARFHAENIARPLFSELLPALNKPIEEFDLDHNGSLSLATELKPAFEQGLTQVMGLMHSPGLVNWYEDLKKLPKMRDIVARIKSPVTYIYGGLDDAQVNARWVDEDLGYFSGRVTTRKYAGLGHCFSPMEGSIGQAKTSGPLSEDLLSALANDLGAVLLR